MSELLVLRYADGAADMDAVRALFREYEETLGAAVCFEGFEAELAGLPGRYADPAGCVLLAEADGKPAGVVALCPMGEGDVAEMKRLYVRPAVRGLGVGRRLAAAVADEARKRAYRRLRLHTLDRFAAAVALYRSMGFAEAAPFDGTPHEGVLWFELAL
ncbi:MAG: GNAT family N-acetyltransferase [Rhodospirillales bacterium]|nr:GNAT family N-acetyltransferase [Rhodospirillales bacterium]